MKIALVSDIHLGVKKSADYFLNNQLTFFKEEFLPVLKKENVEEIHILGDLMDNRNHINVKVLDATYKLFAETLKDYTIKILVGNHDSHYKTTIKVNSLSFLNALPHVEVIDEIKIDDSILAKTGKKVLQVPWLVDEADFRQRVAKQNIDIDYCFGHFEVSGFSYNQHTVNLHGLDPNVLFDNFPMTFTGHFHKRSCRVKGDSRIQYLGCPYQITRNDKNEDKGFAILDVLTGEYDFHFGKNTMKFVEIKFPEEFTRKQVEGNIVDVKIEYDENYKETLVQQYIRIIEKYNPMFAPTMKIENKMIAGDVLEIEHQSIDDLLKEYVDSLEIENKDYIYNELIGLLKECQRG